MVGKSTQQPQTAGRVKGSIRRNLALVVFTAIIPALLLMVYSGIEQRRGSIDSAKQDVLLLSRTLAEIHLRNASAAQQMLVTLSLLQEVHSSDLQKCTSIFQSLCAKYPQFLNIALSSASGQVLAAANPFSPGTTLGDRKHVQEALEKKRFTAGEFIVSKFAPKLPAFPFAYPVLDSEGQVKSVLTTAINLSGIGRFHDISNLPELSFIAVTDHQGIRLFYYPANPATNPIGSPINPASWNMVDQEADSGIFIGQGSDGIRRIFAYQRVSLTTYEDPNIYLWAAVPEEKIIAPANAGANRNLIVLSLTGLASLLVAYRIGSITLVKPINRLLSLTKRFAEGSLTLDQRPQVSADELGTLTQSFYHMADSLSASQKNLQENEARFRLLLDSLDALIYVADIATDKVLFINKQGKNIFGDITGEICWKALQIGQNGPCAFCSNRLLLNSDGTPGKVHTWEYTNPKTGSTYYIHDRAIYWVDGRVVRLEVAVDITQRMKAEAHLAEEKERLAVTMQSIGDGIITTDAEGKVVLLNQAAESMTGWSQSEARGLPLDRVFTLVDEQNQQAVGSVYLRVKKTGTVQGPTANALLVARTGDRINVAESCSPILDPQGGHVGVVLVFRNISEELRTEKELLRMQKLESLGVLAGGIAHDFNNILAAILGNINLALLDKGLVESTRTLMQDAENATVRARRLTQQLLTFAKGGEPVKETASLKKVITDSADFVLHGDSVACEYAIADDLWLTAVDTGQISQVVHNMVLNASQAMPEGGTIRITAENVYREQEQSLSLAHEQYVKVVIQDSGTGIPAAYVDTIFDPYFTTKNEGNGLGLAIAQSIITKHEGLIEVTSVPGQGTTFSIYLPASADDRPVHKAVDAPGHQPSALRILLMDDDPLVRSMIESMLHHLGHEVVVTGGSDEAVSVFASALLNGAPFDLVILDLTIPGGIGGRETAQRLLRLAPDSKLIVSSGYSTDPIMSEYAAHGFCAALAKPFVLNDVKAAIHQAFLELHPTHAQ